MPILMKKCLTKIKSYIESDTAKYTSILKMIQFK